MLKRGLVAAFVLLVILGHLAMASGQDAAAPTSVLVKLVPGLTPESQAAVITRNGGVEISFIPALRLHVVQVAIAELAAVTTRYQSDPLVEHVEDNRVRVSEAIPSDPLYTSQWALPKIGWDNVFGAVDVPGTAKVAILDTGVDAQHPDLAGVVVPGISMIDGSNGMVDPSGHGTWLAGIVAARTDAVPMEGIAGVAFTGVQIIPVTVLNSAGEGRDSDVIAGVIWAADHGADVLLMAFSDPGFSRNLQDAIDYAWSKGAVIVAAAGNTASGEPTFPAGDRGVMGVAATDATDAPAYFSNAGEAIFIAAPGVDVLSTAIGDGYDVVSGTSMSAAIVAGAAALMKASDPSLSNGVIVGRLARNADPAGTQADTGNGRVNLPRALADTSTEFVQPAGAAPVGEGGPFVGPYLAANVTNVAITSPSSVITIPSTSLPVSVSVSFDYSTSTTGATSATVDVLGTSGSTTQAIAPGVNKSDTILVTVPSGASLGAHNLKVTVTNTVGSGSNQKNDQKNGIIVITADTIPPLITPSVTGTAGANGWYTSDVTVSWTVTDAESPISSQTGCGTTTLTVETAGTTLTCTATSAGGTAASSVTIKLDKTPPSALLAVTAGTAGSNGWYTSDVTVTASGSDSISTPIMCTGPQVVSTETAGTTLNGSCTNDAGLTTEATPLIAKLVKSAPVVTLTAIGTAGANGWYTSDVTVHTGSIDTIGSPITCTADQAQNGETTGTLFTGSCTNDAGLVGTGTLSVKVDKTPPVVSLAIMSGPRGDNSWYTSDVVLHTSGTETISTPIVCDADQSQTSDTAGATFTGSCTNAAGLKGTSTGVTVKVDKTPPTATLTVVAGTVGANGWYTSDVTVRASGEDSVSGPVTCTPDQFQTVETTGTTFNGSCKNAAGLTTPASPVTVKLDKTAPTGVTLALSGTAGANGWYTSDVTATTNGTEGISLPLACTTPQLLSAETAGTAVTGSCTNAAGLSTDATPVTVKIDKTPPSAALVVTAGTLGLNGWYTSNVTISTQGSDSVSTPVTCTGDQLQGTDTPGVVFNGSCTNAAGLSASATPLTVKLDKTPPTVSINSDIADGASYYFGFVPAYGSCYATDATSGPPTPACALTGYGTTVGQHALTAKATDEAGNVATRTRSYTVLAWTLRGFYQPLEMNGAWNSVKGGATVPLKFEVFAGPTELTDTSIVSLSAARVTCTADEGDPIDLVSTGGTSLRYDSVAGQYIFNWQTPRAPGQCHRITLTTQDSSSISAFFKLK
jgi:hypothetical protein